MSFWSVFLKTHLKKPISCQKRHLGRFWRLLTFLAHFKTNIDQNNICGSTVFKDKQKKNMKKYFFKGFCFKTHKRAVLGSTNFLNFFYSVLALKTVDAQMLLWSTFFKMH